MVELDTYLFDPETIEQLDWNLIGDSITISKGFKIRPLKLNDYGRGYLKVISQLTDVGDVMREEFEGMADSLLRILINLHYYI